MKKIAFIQPAGKPAMTVYYDDKASENPYRVYLEGHKPHPSYGYYVPFKRQIERYADLLSAVCEIHRYISINNEEGR